MSGECLDLSSCSSLPASNSSICRGELVADVGLVADVDGVDLARLVEENERGQGFDLEGLPHRHFGVERDQADRGLQEVELLVFESRFDQGADLALPGLAVLAHSHHHDWLAGG